MGFFMLGTVAMTQSSTRSPNFSLAYQIRLLRLCQSTSSLFEPCPHDDYHCALSPQRGGSPCKLVYSVCLLSLSKRMTAVPSMSSRRVEVATRERSGLTNVASGALGCNNVHYRTQNVHSSYPGNVVWTLIADGPCTGAKSSDLLLGDPGMQ